MAGLYNGNKTCPVWAVAWDNAVVMGLPKVHVQGNMILLAVGL